ncbi:MAG: PRTRC system ThiF family protein [Bacteroidetes bacterium]|nr:PRTRC system ThiF family protein [Bacteroidota bacterium]
MIQQKARVHFVDNYLINPTNPVLINLIGAGGTGSQVLTALARINHALNNLNHAGLFVHAFDGDVITEANLGRQLFAPSEIGIPKAVALIDRLNRFFGTNWKAHPEFFSTRHASEKFCANITISCVDTVKARFEIAEILKHNLQNTNSLARPMYWIDFGNSKCTGQVLVSTVSDIRQPSSKQYKPVRQLPFITEEFKSLLNENKENDEPSCSLAEALTKQDLFINSSLANLGASLLWNMFREGMLVQRGFFLNLKDFRTQPIMV